MNKEKLITAGIWISIFSILVFLSAISLYAGSNNARHGNYLLFSVGVFLIPFIFLCAYKGIKMILESIFN